MQYEEDPDNENASNVLEYFLELDQVLQMIGDMKPCTSDSFEKDYQEYKEILSRYQEQPHLLDPHMDRLLQCLLTRIRNTASTADDEMHAAFKYLYVICKVRTFKVLVKYLPHELTDLEFVLELLERQEPKAFANWETRYMLLLWMSICVINPFHMSRLDAYGSGGGGAGGGGADSSSLDVNVPNHHPVKSKMERIFDLCKMYSLTGDTCATVGSYLSAKFLVRSDIKDMYLEQYFDWVIGQHKPNTVDVKFGQLMSIAAILKHGKREDLLPYADKLLQWILACPYKNSSDFLKYKMYMKIMQRIGMVYLKPRLASWRYQRGVRSLVTNLNQQSSAESTAATPSSPNSAESSMEGEEIIVADGVEEVIEELLHGLRSGGNEIRWNAAKGIGRVTNRLSRELGDEVIGSVMDLLNPLEPHEAWHGGCLALAELAKRGLLLPHRLREVVPLLSEALFYDEVKGYMFVGQNIRDAACYMCWAFARAYNPDDLQPFVLDISVGLLTVAVFDREINCRRAASAAFQESVGRLGNFPHGIEICTATDFYSVGSRQNAYWVISDFIAQFEEYRMAMIDHLVSRKINHWDVAIRELAAKALHKLTHRSPEYMVDVVLHKLIPKTDAADINVRHGSVLAIGEIVAALRPLETARLEKEAAGEDEPMEKLITDELCAHINDLIKKFLTRDLFRGMSGEIMKQCCTAFIRNCSAAVVPITLDCLDSWQQIIDKCLVSKAATVHEAAVAAFAAICRAYYASSEAERMMRNAEIVRAYLKGAAIETDEHLRMGYLAALGVLPRELIMPHIDELLKCLIRSSIPPPGSCMTLEATGPGVPTEKWSEARRAGVRALSQVVQTLGFAAGDGEPPLVSFANAKYFGEVVDCLILAMDEYTVDNRGDIGAWVREAAMTGIFDIINQCPPSVLQPGHMHQIMFALMRQSVEKIDRTRGLAGRLICCLVNKTNPAVPHIIEHERLRQALPPESETKVFWYFADQTFPLFCALLDLPAYSKHIMTGLIASIGQLTESLIKHSSTALFQFLRSHPPKVAARLCSEVTEIFEENHNNERITYPMLNFLDILIGSGTINNVLLDEQNPFAEDLYRLLSFDKGQKKLYKFTSSISVFCQLLQVPRLSKRVLSKLALFLGMMHVHVRKTAATKLYEALVLHNEACGINDEHIDDVLLLLSETDWSAPLVEVRPQRNKLCELLGIKSPVGGSGANATDAH